MSGTGPDDGNAIVDPPLTLLAVTHGAPSADNRSAIIGLVDAVAAEVPAVQIGISFVDAQNSDVAAALAQHASTPAVIVPLVLSAGFHVRTGLSQGINQLPPGGPGLAEPLGPDPRIVEVLAERLEAIGLGPSDAIVLAAAGSNDPRAVRECFETGRLLGARLGRAVTVGFIAAAIPRLPDAIEMIREVHPGSRVIVATYLLAPGAFNDAANAVGADAVSEPLMLPGRPAPGPIVELVVDRYLAAVERLGRHLS
ncbi:sirohydrochlorin chelatase [Agromyces albus]|uniref:sirohydrochlorin chelatase n=1 Tax=Agromyces albus TaxID=205332 RepID=UPI002781E558|nr:CbiX/SirB N-terminal domain-containing protein [Agromyces albus]MDQ0575697.1 sirohydrochlorin ferrochelatase [Agromyces albus]